MRRIFRIILGFSLLIAGLLLALPGVPGPGFVVVFLGLVLLSKHFTWAQRMRNWAKLKLAKARMKAGFGEAE